MMIKKCETCGIRYKHGDCFLEYANFKDDLIEIDIPELFMELRW